jgi:hypothetical protein
LHDLGLHAGFRAKESRARLEIADLVSGESKLGVEFMHFVGAELLMRYAEG